MLTPLLTTTRIVRSALVVRRAVVDPSSRGVSGKGCANQPNHFTIR